MSMGVFFYKTHARLLASQGQRDLLVNALKTTTRVAEISSKSIPIYSVTVEWFWEMNMPLNISTI